MESFYWHCSGSWPSTGCGMKHMYVCVCTCVLCTVYCVLCIVYCVLCTVYCVLCTVYCVLCTVYCVLFIVYCVLCTVYCVLCTVYCVLCTVYCVLCTVYCVLCTVYLVYVCSSPMLLCHRKMIATATLYMYGAVKILLSLIIAELQNEGNYLYYSTTHSSAECAHGHYVTWALCHMSTMSHEHYVT